MVRYTRALLYRPDALRSRVLEIGDPKPDNDDGWKDADWRALAKILELDVVNDRWRATRAHVVAKAEAEARIAEAKAAAAELAAEQGGTAGALLLLEDVVGEMPPQLRDQLVAWLIERDKPVIVQRDLGAGVTEEDRAKFAVVPGGAG